MKLTINPSKLMEDKINDMLKNMWKPVVMTSITTSVGFISLLTSQVYPIKYFGIFTAFGVLAAMLFSLTLIPAGIMIFGLPKVKKAKIKQANDKPGFADKFASWVIKRKSVSMIATAVINFETEAIRKRCPGFTSSPVSLLAIPNPFA